MGLHVANHWEDSLWLDKGHHKGAKGLLLEVSADLFVQSLEEQVYTHNLYVFF